MTYGEDGNYDAVYTYGLERIEVEDIDETRPESQDPLYYLYDGLGSVTNMVKPDGNARDHYRYDEYGKPAPGNTKLSEDGRINLNNTFGYTGEMWDEETNLLYLRARYYEPETGRFLSRDTYEGQPVNPLSRNLYAYVQNNPVNRIDSNGHFPILPLLMKAGSNGAADLMAQAAMNYYFNPNTAGDIGKSFGAVNWWQVGRSSAEGLIPWKTPGGRLGRAAITAVGDVLVNAADIGINYSAEQAVKDFAVGFIGDLAGGGLGELTSKYGIKAVANGLKKMGFHYHDVAKFLGGGVKKINKTLNAVTATRMMKGWGTKVAVIGRNMDDRVKKFAAGIKGAETFSPSEKAKELYKAGDSSLLMQENKAWVQNLINEGYTVYDVGLDPEYTAIGNYSKGEFYGMETEKIFGD